MEGGIETLSQELEKMQGKMESFKLNKDCDTIYLLGVTGSGKSTTVNYFLKKAPLPETKVRGRYQIESVEDGPVIGHTNNSCTEIPAIYKDPSGDRIYIDPPGFMDTKGPLQETTNGLCNALMFEKGVKTKIILVIQYSTINSGRGGNIPEIAKRLFELFGRDFDRLINSIIILVTKVNTEDVKIEYIVDDLRSISEKNKNMTDPIKAMIAGIIENNNVLMLPLPKQIDQDTIPKILNTIDKTMPTTLSCQANISLSYEAKAMLQDLGNTISQQINSCIKQIRYDLQNKFLNVTYGSVKQYDSTINRLKIAQNSVDRQIGEDWEQGFENFSGQITLSETITSKVVAGARKMNICNKLGFPIKLNIGIIEAISECLKGVISQLLYEMSKLTTEEKLKEMNNRHEKALSDQNSNFKKMMEDMKKSADAREENTRKQIEAQKNHSQKVIEQAQKNHAEQMEKMRAETEKLRKNQVRQRVVQVQRPGRCQLI